MDIKTRHVINNYWAYACPRCIGGTMAWEKDKAGEQPYLKCILCGAELRREEKVFGKSRKNARKNQKFEAKLGEDDKNKRNKNDKKSHNWQFSHAQSENKT